MTHSDIRRWLLIVAGVLALVVLGWLGRALLPEGDGELLGTLSDCQPAAGCTLILPEGSIRLGSDRPPSSHEPFTLTVRLEGISADAVALDLDGVEMFMGVNHYPLEDAGNGRFSRTLRIPVCTTGRMLWRARLTLTRNSQSQRADFLFEAE